MLKTALFILLVLLSAHPGYCQDRFSIENGKTKDRIRFELINNLIIIPVELNGVNLSFLLDTGVETSVLLNLEEADSLELKDAQKITLRGLGGEELLEAYKSENNRMRIGNTVNENFTLFLIYDEAVNFSPRLGTPVHGIIGYDLFSDFVVEINYTRKFIRLHERDNFRKDLRKYSELPLRFYRNKPYVNSHIEIGGDEIEAFFLIDNGLGDAVWLFGEDQKIRAPGGAFEDFLGLGLLGDVTGKRSRIGSIRLGDHVLENVTAAFPDSSSVEGLRIFEGRDGSIGGEVLKRFNAFVDYENRKLYLRKNRNFRQPFSYDMSGIIPEHSGFVVVRTYEKARIPALRPIEGQEVFNSYRSRSFELKPSYHIVRLRPDSPAEKAGLQVGDVILSVNGRKAYRFKLNDLTSFFSSEEGKRIKLEVERGGKKIAYRFRLKKML